MGDPRQQWLMHLHGRAAHCRRLAEGASSESIAEELLGLARSYEDEALGIEFKVSDDRTGLLHG
jgi:hypothetical protein